VAVADATVAAVVIHPDGVTSVPVPLTADGAGEFIAGDASEYS